MNILYRSAQRRDRDELAALFLECRRAAFPWRARDSMGLEDFALETEGEEIVVAQDASGRLLGFASVWRPDRFIHHFFVRPESQRRGIGRGLLRHLLTCIEPPYRLKCATRNIAAMTFYRAHGWQEAGSGKGADGDYVVLQLDRAGLTAQRAPIP